MTAATSSRSRLWNAFEKEIQSHNQQIEALSKRLVGLKRAVEL